MNFRECATSWQDSVAILRKPATQVGFRSRVRKLNEYLGDVPVTAITERKAQEVFSALYTGGLSARSVKVLYGAFRVVMESARRDGLIAAVPKPSLPKIARKEQPWFTAEEMALAIKSAATLKRASITPSLATTISGWVDL